MLRLDHPMTEHIFHASGLLDSLLMAGQRMSVSPSAIRIELLSKCVPRLAELRELARLHFSDRLTFLATGIDELEFGLRQLAELGGGKITEDRSDGSGECPVCCTTSTHYAKYNLVLCSKCDELFMPAHLKLCSFVGFGTDFI